MKKLPFERLDKTAEHKIAFEKITGLKAIRFSKNTGSMRPWYSVTVSAIDPIVKDFSDNYYKTEKAADGTKDLAGIKVTFMDSEFKEKRSFSIPVSQFK